VAEACRGVEEPRGNTDTNGVNGKKKRRQQENVFVFSVVSVQSVCVSFPAALAPQRCQEFGTISALIAVRFSTAARASAACSNAKRPLTISRHGFVAPNRAVRDTAR
jgi:hypothetical protein